MFCGYGTGVKVEKPVVIDGKGRDSSWNGMEPIMTCCFCAKR